MGNVCNCYKDESSVGIWWCLASTLNITVFAYCHPYLLLPEAWLKKDGLAELQY